MLKLRGGTTGGGASAGRGAGSGGTGGARPPVASGGAAGREPDRPVVTPARARPSSGVTRIGARLGIVGDLYSDDPVEIAGQVQGTVVAPTVTVEAGGAVHGGIQAVTAEIRGTVSGRVEAFSVSIRSSAEVSGNVLHHEIEVERGARIDGPMPWRPRSYFEEDAGRDAKR